MTWLEIAVFAATVLLAGFLRTRWNHVDVKYAVMFIAVLLFELMSEPMWDNYGLADWAYIYGDVSWVITLGWVTIFLLSVYLVDTFTEEHQQRFWWYLGTVTIITLPIEVLLYESGFRGYEAVLTETMTGVVIPFTTTPIEVIVTIPMIAALVIPFYQYITHLLLDEPIT